jgi:serine/threonine protein kinase
MFDSQLNSGFTTTENINISGHFTEIGLLHASSNGYSEIYKAKRYGRWHVLKCLTKEAKSNPIYQTLLEKEFTIAYPINHPNVVRTLGMELVENLGWCIVQEYIDGDTLQTITQKQLEQLCDALIYIHHLGITHRDLKPENILVTNNTNDIVLLDFGLADKADFTILKSAAGTTGYIAPEQLAEGIINPQVDIFALGVILSKQKQWKRIAKRCMLANPQKRYLSVDEIKHTIKQKSPWIGRGIAIVLIICAVIIGLSLQLYHQQLSLTHQQQVVIDLDSNNIVLTEQILDYQRQVDSLKNDLYSANQRVDLSQNEIIKKLSDIESIQKTITTENLDPSTQALLKQYQQEVIWLQTQLEEANQRYNVLWEKYEEEEYKERVKSQR